MSLLLLFTNDYAERSLGSGSNAGSRANVIVKGFGDATTDPAVTAITSATKEGRLSPVMPAPTIDPNTGRPT